MKPAIYIETTIPSYLTARPAGDVVLAAHHQLTRRWWKLRLGDFRAYTSQFVLDEAAEGNPVMARKRLAFLRNLPLLATTNEALTLGRQLLATGIFPQAAARDASHISLAATHGVHFLLTWNCTHLANAALFERVRAICEAAGCSWPVICTPLELMES
jgi:hypothetical protein